MDCLNLEFYQGRRVFVTGHTGFKGTWLCHMLALAGAQVTGYSLPAPTQPNLFELSELESKITSVIGDVRNHEKLMTGFCVFAPQPKTRGF